MFALSVSEIGTLVSLGSKESCEFIHDPNKGNRYLINFVNLLVIMLLCKFS